MAKSLQQIDDYYLSQGLKGEALRSALENDSEYQRLLKERKAVINNKYGITEEEEKEYLLPNEEDYEILSIVKTLKNENLSETDIEIVELIKTQLQDDWRGPLLEKLKKLLQKYS
ncbi:hypothetical protein A3B45_05200 [Candidatus Daviesbacteria bacterium RIFCSPLOWO2_01_FULL_39_12]|uniref:Uncharacterized protein n=1 Tax=Candidatus Daviesbacteria bacterium RIFCSPLOWO2_01_FULL_39_12 TaxID=1797785 RepID=A0A1F5KUC8_9BACT|nr:MAG: hypothetical protein A3B45_05200 [Candidatus Daviesbacteria bacterium RIFCSPLOWO2_01_FULL_39_12]